MGGDETMTLLEKIEEFQRENYIESSKEIEKKIKDNLAEKEDGTLCYLLGRDHAFESIIKLLEDFNIDVKL